MREERDLIIETEEFMPFYGSEGAAGFDLKAFLPNGPVIMYPGNIIRIPSGIKMGIPEGYEVQLRSRSGLSYKHGIVVNQGCATIDEDFKGEVGILLRNVSKAPYQIEHGARVCQGILAPVTRANFVKGEVVNDTVRGEGAYGSTGK